MANCNLAPAFRIYLPLSLRSRLDSLRAHLIPLNFITLHYAYFISVCLVMAIIFWGSSTPARSVSFTDSLFLTVSAMTLAGLNTVNLSQLNTFQQFLLFLLTMLGSAILVSIGVVHVRKKAFERKFSDVIEKERQRRKALKTAETWRFSLSPSRRRQTNESRPRPEVDGVVVRGSAIAEEKSPTNPGDFPRKDMQLTAMLGSDAGDKTMADDMNGADGAISGLSTNLAVASPRIRFETPVPSSPRSHRVVLSMSGVGARRESLTHTKNAKLPFSLSSVMDERGELRRTHKYFQSGGFIGRNSQFHSLTVSEREQLGGVEYRALILLEMVVILYFVLFQLLGCIGLGAWVAINQASTSLENGLNPWFVAASVVGHGTHVG